MVTYVVETTYLDASGAAVDSEKVSVEGIVKCREISANTRVSLPYAVDTDTCCFSIREPQCCTSVNTASTFHPVYAARKPLFCRRRNQKRDHLPPNSYFRILTVWRRWRSPTSLSMLINASLFLPHLASFLVSNIGNRSTVVSAE